MQSAPNLPVIDEVWRRIELSLNCTIEEHLKRLLQLNGFHNIEALKDLDKDDLDFIVQDVQSGRILNRIEEAHLHLYLGPVKNMAHFFLAPGEVKFLKKLSQHVRENHKISAKPIHIPISKPKVKYF